MPKAVSWYTYGDVRVGQGRENSKAFLEEHSDLAEEIAGKIRDALKAVASPNGHAELTAAGARSDD